MDNKSLNKHIETLKKKVFFTNTKWPHFEILFNDLTKLSKIKKYKTIVSLERGSLYGNISLFAPLFKKKNFISLECSTKKIKSRGSYNKKYVKDDNIIKIPLSHHVNYKNLKLKKNFADLIIIPNLMHHIYDHHHLLKQCKSILKKGGDLYIFEPTLREIHQLPEDYFRFTPYGLENILKSVGFKKVKHDFSGGPFTAILYCIDQAMQYLPKNKIGHFKKKFLIDFKELIKLDKFYKRNLVRKNTKFPMSFSIIAQV